MISLSFLILFSISVNADNPGHHHKHGKIEASAFKAIPELSLEVYPDAVKGWNIRLVTKNFRFAPENVNKKPVPGEGHAHLYVDGKKVARLYSPWFHLKPQSPGPHTIRVTLNANNHSDLAIHGKPIEAVKKIVQVKSGK